MAYARKGERGSDVFVWADDERWYCDDCALHGGRRISVEKPDYGTLGHHLLTHLARGHVVPDEVFDRINAEMDGRLYVTDAVRALPEEMLVEWVRQQVSQGATHECEDWRDGTGTCQACGGRR